MLEVKGKFNTAKIFTDVVDEASISQVTELCNQEFCAGSRIRLMPDIHAGAGCTIGTTMTITDKIVPNLVGVDIGCGMHTVRIAEKEIDLEKLDKLIYERIPSGFNIHDKTKSSSVDLSKLRCAKHVDIERAKRSIGTLGGGNHFIEVDKDDDGNLYIVVHSGSRHIGLEVAKYYQEAGYRALCDCDKGGAQEIVERLKSEGRFSEIADAVKEYKAKHQTKIPKSLVYLSGDLFDDYLHDMQIIQRFAFVNRFVMLSEIISGMGVRVVDDFVTIHNYIDAKNMILRKGAVSAQKGEKLLIPINMRDGSLICIGKGNEDWNFSAPHGAGRLMSRAAAKRTFTVDDFRSEMDGIYTTSANQDTLDECPMAYKSMEAIVDNIGPTAEVVKVIKPIYNFKAGGD